jgi:hypothetical protein
LRSNCRTVDKRSEKKAANRNSERGRERERGRTRGFDSERVFTRFVAGWGGVAQQADTTEKDKAY